MSRPNDSNIGPTASVDDRFDQHARALHLQSLEHLSPNTRARLAQRRSTAHRHRGAWLAATSSAAALALVVGLQLRPHPSQPDDSRGASPATPVATVVTDATDTTYATYDENPDLYLWLASGDAVALASE